MFEPESKNRRLTPKEQETDKQLCQIFKRPPLTYIKDKPFYPWLPLEPLVNQPFVNFALNFTE